MDPEMEVGGPAQTAVPITDSNDEHRGNCAAVNGDRP